MLPVLLSIRITDPTYENEEEDVNQEADKIPTKEIRITFRYRNKEYAL